ncbi:AAA family ATPase [Kitasatospora sp. NPDC088160]|uniref:AAA family ATPase n=1 Tax=Kitasatospora sp. NPDC088160 TaxID=3364072 RepID=UPI00380D0DA2
MSKHPAEASLQGATVPAPAEAPFLESDDQSPQTSGPSLTLPDHIHPNVRELVEGLPEPLRTAVIVAINTEGGVRITSGNAKGGVMKTTLSVYISLMLALTGEHVLLVDADETNKTCLKWQAAVGQAWPSSVTVVQYSGSLMTKQVTDLMAKGYKHLVIDVGPTHTGVLKAAWALTKRGIVPTQQHVGDIVQLATTFQLLQEMGEEIDLHVLLARSYPKRVSYSKAQDFIEDTIEGRRPEFPDGLQTVSLLESTVPMLEGIADTWGTLPDDFTHFSSVLAEALGVPHDVLEALTRGEE